MTRGGFLFVGTVSVGSRLWCVGLSLIVRHRSLDTLSLKSFYPSRWICILRFLSLGQKAAALAAASGGGAVGRRWFRRYRKRERKRACSPGSGGHGEAQGTAGLTRGAQRQSQFLVGVGNGDGRLCPRLKTTLQVKRRQTEGRVRRRRS